LIEYSKMMTSLAQDYAALDVPEVLLRLFHPRPELALFNPPTSGQEIIIPVDPGVVIGGRFYAADTKAPTLLFFHGNGEIAADYEDLGPLYNRQGLNFLPVDYRGYGRSTGEPTVSNMMSDCHVIFAFAQEWLNQKGFSGPLAVMGRSLGSASALELAAAHQDRLAGLIIESGFAYAGPLLKLLGVNVGALGFIEETGFRNVDKIRHWRKPLLIIHAEFDHIIPFAEGQALYEASHSLEKTFLKVAGANHNDILAVGFAAYLEAVASLGALLKREKAFSIPITAES
jgi:pimeloyl-ACP methyl ester carboxylesterase